MTFKPRQVDPGYQRRWVIETLELVRRAPEIWVLLAIVFSATGFVLYPLLGTGQCVLGFFEIYVMAHLAHAASEREIRLVDLVEACRKAGTQTVSLLRNMFHDVVLLFVPGMCLLEAVMQNIGYFLHHSSPVVELLRFNPHSLQDWLVWRQSPLLCCEYGVMWGITLGGPLFFMVTALLGPLDFPTVRHLCAQARASNRAAVMHALIVSACVLFAGYTIAPLAPLACVLYPLYAFVVARDFFIHGEGNRKLDKTKVGRFVRPQMT